MQFETTWPNFRVAIKGCSTQENMWELKSNVRNQQFVFWWFLIRVARCRIHERSRSSHRGWSWIFSIQWESWKKQGEEKEIPEPHRPEATSKYVSFPPWKESFWQVRNVLIRYTYSYVWWFSLNLLHCFSLNLLYCFCQSMSIHFSREDLLKMKWLKLHLTFTFIFWFLCSVCS